MQIFMCDHPQVSSDFILGYVEKSSDISWKFALFQSVKDSDKGDEIGYIKQYRFIRKTCTVDWNLCLEHKIRTKAFWRKWQ